MGLFSKKTSSCKGYYLGLGWTLNKVAGSGIIKRINSYIQ